MYQTKNNGRWKKLVHNGRENKQANDSNSSLTRKIPAMTNKLNENSLAEQPVIEWLKELGYDYEFGPDLAPGQITAERENFRDVVLLPRLRRSLARINPSIQGMEDMAIDKLFSIEHPNLEEENRQVFKMLIEGSFIEGATKRVELTGEEERLDFLFKFFDFENPQNNEFLVVN